MLLRTPNKIKDVSSMQSKIQKVLNSNNNRVFDLNVKIGAILSLSTQLFINQSKTFEISPREFIELLEEPFMQTLFVPTKVLKINNLTQKIKGVF